MIFDAVILVRINMLTVECIVERGFSEQYLSDHVRIFFDNIFENNTKNPFVGLEFPDLSHFT